MEVGQKVYIVPYDSRYNPFYSNVIKIGKKYITVDNIHKSKNRFRICDYEQECGNYSSECSLYESKEDYQKQLSDIKERHDFIDKIHDKLNTLRVEQLKETFDFISKY